MMSSFVMCTIHVLHICVCESGAQRREKDDVLVRARPSSRRIIVALLNFIIALDHLRGIATRSFTKNSRMQRKSFLITLCCPGYTECNKAIQSDPNRRKNDSRTGTTIRFRAPYHGYNYACSVHLCDDDVEKIFLGMGAGVFRATSSSTKKTTMTTAAKLYGKDLSEYDDVDVDELLSQLTPEEINILAKEVDPDDSFMPPSQRCSYECTKTPTGPLNRKKLIEHINKQALETPDIPEIKPYVPGVVRGKKYEQALSNATEDEIIDLAAILGFHSMMNQDQYHASLLNSGQPLGMGWDGITKASQPKVFPMDPPNDTDVDDTIRRVREDDHLLADVNWNNIKNISDEKFMQLFEAIENNTHLETLSLTNVGLTDKAAQRLADALEKNSTLRVLNVETNFISPPVIVKLVKSLLNTKAIEEFRCSNQRSQVLGNKIEMEITQLVEQNPTLLRLGLHLEFNDARHRVAAHLQRNIDRIKRLKNPDSFLCVNCAERIFADCQSSSTPAAALSFLGAVATTTAQQSAQETATITSQQSTQQICNCTILILSKNFFKMPVAHVETWPQRSGRK
ncbi:unnamed protein product [Trichogramma brassicae]|uniref:Tropomodulin n=1 Tax=Trichogramma brassicae TaxID=86971 RepID=A0A6H5IG64_9HYME|nr:unnamed protein product [Trichogramma brassicae]